MCLSKDLITEDIHTQVGLNVDFILKSSLARQSLDNITAVMLAFEGFEQLFTDHKNIYSNKTSVNTLTINNSNSKLNSFNTTSTKVTTNSSKVDTDLANPNRKLKSANGMIKKATFSLVKNSSLTSSYVSSEIKEKEKLSNNNLIVPLSTKNSNTNNLNPFGNKNEVIKQTPTVIKHKQYEPESVVSSMPSTSKNSKSKVINFNQNSNI